MTLATPANMKRYAYLPNVMAYSPLTGEEYSANAGDYWHLPDDVPLQDANGEPMVLVHRFVRYVDVAYTKGMV